MQDREHRFYSASRRLQLQLSGATHDIFAVDVFYHQSCYLKFVFSQNFQEALFNTTSEREQDTMQAFFLKVKSKVVREKCAYFLNELLNDIKILSEEQGLETPVINSTKSLKRQLISQFVEGISFFPSGKYVLVHPSDVNPCQYAIAALHGCGLRDNYLARSFGRMIRRKFSPYQREKLQLPLSEEDLIKPIDRGVLPGIYNAIHYTLSDSAKLNEYGYAETSSHLRAIKIWSLASDWEALAMQEDSPKQVVMGLVLHRLTGSKEAIDVLHKLNHVPSYRDIRLQNMAQSITTMADNRL